MSKIKLVIILEATLGGIRKHVVDLLCNLESRDYQLFLVYSAIRADSTFLADVTLLRKKGVLLYPVAMEREISLLKDLNAIFSIARILKRIKPDIIHLHGAKAGALGRVSAMVHGNSKVVYSPHGGSFHKFGGIGGSVYLFIEKLLAQVTHQFIGVSEDVCTQVVRRLSVDSSKIKLIYGGIEKRNKKVKNGPKLRKKNGIGKDRFVVLHPALFFEAKGHLQYIEAIGKSTERLDRKVLILLAGDGPLKNVIAKEIQDYELDHSFKFIGYQQNLLQYIQMADVVILLSQNEALGYVLLESMQESKPIIATKVGGIPEVVIDGYNGVLLPIAELWRIVRTLNYYCKHKRQLKRMGINGNKLLDDKFSLETMIEQHDKLYKSIVLN